MTPRTAATASKPAPKSASRKAAQPELNRAALVDRALAVADAESLDAVTIRRLATDFGVTPMALYWHFKNKDELLAAMGDWFFEQVSLEGLDQAGDWTRQLAYVLDQLVGVFRRHPASVSLGMPRIMQSAPGLELTERALQLLHDAGFSVQDAADVARNALLTALMLVSGMPGGEFALAEDERAASIEQKRRAVAALPAEQFPRLRESVDALTGCDDVDAYFSSGTELFVAGVAARHARRTTPG